jgi:putative ABC transport system permease protein
MHDLKFALRAFARTPGGSILVVVTLGVAIAVVTIIASTVDMVWHFIPAVRTERLVFVASTDPRPEQSRAGMADGMARAGVSIPDLLDWSARANSFEEFAAFTFQSAALTGLDVPSRIFTVQATRNLLDVWGITPQIGRTFVADEATPGRERVIVVSHTFWQRQLSGASDAVGKTLSIDGHPHTIVGVLPSTASTGIFRTMDAVTPIVLDRNRGRRDDRRLYVTAVLKRGVKAQQAEADLTAVARQLQTDYPLTNAKTGVVVRPLIELLGANINAVVYLLSLIAVIVFCIACANVSSIIHAQAATRRRELAVRSALGAGRLQQLRQLMIESLVTSSAAGALGLLLAWWGLIAIRFVSGNIDGFGEMTLNGRILGITIALSLLAPLGFALLPALRMSRPDMDELRQGNRGAESTKGRRLREALVAAQMALALILMTQVGLIGRTTWKLHHLDKGFDPAQLLTLRMNLDETGYPDPAVAHNFYTRAIERIQALPGVISAGTSSAVPFVDREVSEHFSIQGRPAPAPDSKPQAARAAVSADYLKTMRIPIVRGRGFDRADFANAPPVALVSREAARRYWSGEDPIGRRIAFDGDQNAWLEVVGVAGDVRNSNAGSGPTPQVYVPDSWQPERSTAFVVRSAGADPTALAPSIRSELAQLDKSQPVYDIRSMQRVLVEDLGGTYLFTGMLGFFAIVALMLSAAGVYGLVSFTVSQRTREIGLRMALGAKPAAILGMVVARGSVPMIIGLVFGSAGAAALVSMTAAALSEIDLRDPVAYIVVAVPLIVVALIATYIPARRATHVDPLLALRMD